MKIITKKSVIFTALAAVLLATALVISCNNPLDGISDKGEPSNKEEPSKPGTGKVRLSINNTAGRTILPVTGGYPENMRYLLKLAGKTGGGYGGVGDSQTYYVDVPVASTQQTVNDIPAGTYASAQVIVYVSATALNNSTAAAAYVALAIGESAVDSSGFIISPSPAPAASLGSFITDFYLPGAASSVGTGSFVYEITNAAVSRLNEVRFSIKSRVSGSYLFVDPTTYNNVLAELDDETKISSIPSGSYNVIYSFTDKKTSDIYSFYEILHVYKGVDSVYTLTIDNNFFSFVAGDGNATITISPPKIPGLTTTAGLVAGANATVTGSLTGAHKDGWNVEIDNGDVGSIVFTVTSPSGGVTFNDLLECSGYTSIMETSISTVKGITVSNAGQVFTITFNTNDPNFPLSGTTDTQIELKYGNIPFNSYHLFITINP